MALTHGITAKSLGFRQRITLFGYILKFLFFLVGVGLCGFGYLKAPGRLVGFLRGFFWGVVWVMVLVCVRLCILFFLGMFLLVVGGFFRGFDFLVR